MSFFLSFFQLINWLFTSLIWYYVRLKLKTGKLLSILKKILPTYFKMLCGWLMGNRKTNAEFTICRRIFGKYAKESNPKYIIPNDDLWYFLIERFINIFNESQFHWENNIACELQRVIDTFFTGTTRKKNTLVWLTLCSDQKNCCYYNYCEKQKFFKSGLWELL